MSGRLGGGTVVLIYLYISGVSRRKNESEVGKINQLFEYSRRLLFFRNNGHNTALNPSPQIPLLLLVAYRLHENMSTQLIF